MKNKIFNINLYLIVKNLETSIRKCNKQINMDSVKFTWSLTIKNRLNYRINSTSFHLWLRRSIRKLSCPDRLIYCFQYCNNSSIIFLSKFSTRANIILTEEKSDSSFFFFIFPVVFSSLKISYTEGHFTNK